MFNEIDLLIHLYSLQNKTEISKLLPQVGLQTENSKLQLLGYRFSEQLLLLVLQALTSLCAFDSARQPIK